MKSKQEKNKRVTIKQVAAAAGVTIGTVSNVINGTASVTDKTTAKVKAAIRELHYVPNMTAKSLRSKNSKLIGILVPEFNNSFYYRMLSVFTSLAYECGYIVQMFGYEESLEKELKIIDSLVSNSIEIVIILSGYGGDEDGIKRLLDAGKKVILADRVSDMEGTKCICFDNYKEVIRAVELLKARGYRKIGFLSAPSIISNIKEREMAYRKALEVLELPLLEEYIFIMRECPHDALIKGNEYVKSILCGKKQMELPDAFLATSDLLAIGAMKALKEFGYRIPEDIGIIGFDNLDVSAFVEPNLTTIEQDHEIMGQELFRMTKAMHEGVLIEDRIILSQKLIIRSSC